MSKAKELLEKAELVNPTVDPVDEAVDVKKVIKDVIDTESSDDNSNQGKLVSLLKGLAFSDDASSDEFMKRLTDMINDKNFGDLTK